MQYNFFLVAAIAALVPLIVGTIWYNPKVFGNAWMKVNGFEEAKMKVGFNMPLVLGITYVFGFFISMVLSGVVIHQMGFFSMLQNHFKDADTLKVFEDVMKVYGGEFRSFKHGALHGAIAAIGIALPIIGINALFERRSWKYIGIHAGYWFVTLLIMGGILCQFVDLASMA